jgi:hypothetical protein
MKNKLGEFVIKFLEDKTETRKIIKCDDFFQLIADMGINDDSDEIVDIIYYLEDNKTDINFHEANTQNYYTRFRNIERKVQMSKMLKGSKTEVQQMIEKVDSVKVQDRPDWLETYRNDDEDTTPMETSDRDRNLGQDIIDRLTNEIREKIENEPGPTLEELQNEVDVEMGLPRPFNMNELNANEVVDFLTNRVIPERFRENNNN